MPSIIESPHVLLRRQLAEIAASLSDMTDGLHELFVKYKQTQPELQVQLLQEMHLLQSVTEPNSEAAFEWLNQAESSKSVRFLIQYVTESKRLSVNLAKRYGYELPEDRSSCVLCNEDDQFMITKNDLMAAEAWLAMAETTSRFDLPYFQNIPLTTSQKLEVEQMEREVKQVLCAKVASIQQRLLVDAPAQEVSVLDRVDLERLRNLINPTQDELKAFILQHEQHKSVVNHLNQNQALLAELLSAIKTQLTSVGLSPVMFDELNAVKKGDEVQICLAKLNMDFSFELVQQRHMMPQSFFSALNQTTENDTGVQLAPPKQ